MKPESSTSAPQIPTGPPAPEEPMDVTPAPIRPDDIPSCSSLSLSEPTEEPQIRPYEPSPDPSILDDTPTLDEGDKSPPPEILDASYELLERDRKASKLTTMYLPC